MARRRAVGDGYGQMGDGAGFDPGGLNEGGGIGGVLMDAPELDLNQVGQPNDATEEDRNFGNSTTPRELAGPKANPTTSMPPMQPEAPIQLPQGVSVNDAMSADAGTADFNIGPLPNDPDVPIEGFGGPQYGNVENTPPVSMAPNPISSQPATTPTMAPRTQRRSQSNPAIFGESKGSQMFGRADGLLGGGKGFTSSADPSGPLAPTAMMSRLLQLFREQQG